MRKHHEPEKDEFVYSTYITLRNGRRLYARQCGLKAFRFRPSPRQDDGDNNDL